MGIRENTLIEFELARQLQGFIPPDGSNSFYQVGEGRINILTLRDDPEDYRFDLLTDNGVIEVGDGDFKVVGDIKDTDNPYNSITVIKDTSLIVRGNLVINSGTLSVHGTLTLLPGSSLIVENGGSVIFYPDSTFDIRYDSNINVKSGSMNIYGLIKVHLSRVDQVLDVNRITIDSAAVMDVTGLNLEGRPYCLTQYALDLMDKTINQNTQGETNDENGRLGYTWEAGTPKTNSQVIRLSVLWGEAVLGDFKLSILGLPGVEISDLQVLSGIDIHKKSTLYITENYKNNRYMRPELFLSCVIGNSQRSAVMNVDGTVIVEGRNSFITVDRGSVININQTGVMKLSDNATLRSTHNGEEEVVLNINGLLIIDKIEQISSFTHGQINVGETGKIIILNPSDENKRILFSTPNGLEESDLYRLFRDRINHIEYHVTKNTGIEIDKYFEFYSRDFKNWFGDRRIEKAIYDGILVWEDGGFIQLSRDVIPWVNERCSLYHASRLFKSYGSYDSDKLQQVAERLTYAGCGSIVFIFVNGNKRREVTMNLFPVHMKNVVNHPLTNDYVLYADADGKLFMNHNVGKSDEDSIINNSSRMTPIENGEAHFPLL